MCGSLVVIRDYYLKILYRVRLEAIENAGRVLIDRYYNVPDENQLRLKIMIDELDRRKADLLRKNGEYLMPDLTVRLECVFNEVQIARRFVGEGRVLDVGSDHGMLCLPLSRKEYRRFCCMHRYS